MAIPDGRLSTTTVAGNIYLPEDRAFDPLHPYEIGPKHVEDTSEGLLYQVWYLDYDTNTGDVTLNAETTGDQSVVLNDLTLSYLTFTFDQNGRLTMTYTNSTSSYLYWYDTVVARTVTTDLGTVVVNPSVALDDKRKTQSAVNDIMLWYTKPDGGGTHTLYMCLQRDRYETEYEMKTGLETAYLRSIGMDDGLRLQIKTSYVQ